MTLRYADEYVNRRGVRAAPPPVCPSYGRAQSNRVSTPSKSHATTQQHWPTRLHPQFRARIYGVSELNAAVQSLFEDKFRAIWVEGEISNCRPATSGHVYFSLKDTQSQIKCALFKGSARFVKFKPQDGMRVLARGNLEVYEARGEYQLIVELLEPQGVGALQIAFEQLKKKLGAEVCLLPNANVRCHTPSRLGIVTSLGGAVLHDILQILERRFPGLHIRVFPAQVQGEGAGPTNMRRSRTL